MAFSATDDFESYTTNANLTGGAGGSGWSTNWTATTSVWVVDAANAGVGGVYEGIKCVRGNSGRSAYRTFAEPLTSDYISFAFRSNATTLSFVALRAYTGSDEIARVSFNAVAGKITAKTGDAGEVEIGDFVRDGWQRFIIHVDADRYRVSLDGGASWTDWLTVITTGTNAERIFLMTASSSSFTFLDAIAPYTPPALPTFIPQIIIS